MIISNGRKVAIQSLAEQYTTSATSYFYAHDTISLVERLTTYGAVYKTQPILSGIIDKVAALGARLPVHSRDVTDPAKTFIEFDSSYSKLLSQPCPYMDNFTFWVWWITTYEIYGEVYGIKLRRNADTTFKSTDGDVIGVAPMHPTRVWIERKEDGREVFHFALQGSANPSLLDIPRENVIAQRRYNPEGPMRGLSRLESLTRTIQNEDSIRTSHIATWQRGARPSMMLKLLNARGNDKVEIEKFRVKVENKHVAPSKQGGVMVLPAGIEPVALQIDPMKMQMIESLRLTREEYAIRLDIPPPAVHILDKATFSNITEQLRSLYKDVMAPRLEAIQSAWDFEVGSEFGSNFKMEFDMDDVLAGDFESRVDALTKGINAGLFTPNEARQRMTLPKFADVIADKLFANQAMQPLGTPVSSGQAPAVQDQAKPAAPNAATDAPAGTAADAAPAGDANKRSIMGRLGRIAKKSVDEKRSAYRTEFLTVFEKFLDDQRKSVRTHYNVKAWSVGEYDSPLAEELAAVMHSVAKSAGRQYSKDYSPEELQELIDAESVAVANGVNAKTMKSVNDTEAEYVSGEAVDGIFDARLGMLSLTALSLATKWMSAGEQGGATMKGLKSKTWRTGPNPRPAHAKMNGETVGIKDRFSNGDAYPPGNESDDAGCNCRVEYS